MDIVYVERILGSDADGKRQDAWDAGGLYFLIRTYK